ncbi:hypothetical protein [Streptomyces sp. CC224B]|uniref:hypothetical protein n=1 Tax=Streptomyces sp. CC224B TaxID=3044571 RepID=UPI0024A9C8BE|nr:hypothetical protein [Streptomyces sp. CC224B]
MDRGVLCAGPYFALERWRVRSGAALDRAFDTAHVVSNAGAPAALTCAGRTLELDRARTVLLPAALGAVRVHGTADVLVGHLPDLGHDIREPLARAGYGPSAVATLGEGLG